MPEIQPQRKPDAVRCPKHWPQVRGQDKFVLRNRVLGLVLGAPRVWSRDILDNRGESFVTVEAEATLNYPHGHPNQTESRYHWYLAELERDGKVRVLGEVTGDPAEDGRLKVGYLKPDQYADDPAVLASISAALDEKAAEQGLDGLRDVARKLGDQKILSPAEVKARLAEIDAMDREVGGPAKEEQEEAPDAP